jgi:lysine decarboxylase
LWRLLRQPPGRWDLPELPAIGGPLQSEGAVAAAQARAADLLGAERCWFGVNGASGLLQAALLGLAPPGSRVLLPRNLHRSLLHACVLGQLEPLIVDLPFDPLTGLWRPLDQSRLEQVLRAAVAGGPVAALVLVDPTYQGLGGDLVALVAAAHAAGVPVLASQIEGSIGLLGEDYPGLHAVGDDAALAALIARCRAEPAFLADLQSRCAALAPRFEPAREREAVRRLAHTLLAIAPRTPR